MRVGGAGAPERLSRGESIKSVASRQSEEATNSWAPRTMCYGKDQGEFERRTMPTASRAENSASVVYSKAFLRTQSPGFDKNSMASGLNIVTPGRSLGQLSPSSMAQGGLEK